MPNFKPLQISGAARRDLHDIAEHTEMVWGSTQKRTYMALIRDAFKALAATPGMGAPRDHVSEGLRAHPVGRHMVFYRETETHLVIVRVLHQAMDVEARMEPE